MAWPLPSLALRPEPKRVVAFAPHPALDVHLLLISPPSKPSMKSNAIALKYLHARFKRVYIIDDPPYTAVWIEVVERAVILVTGVQADLVAVVKVAANAQYVLDQ